MFTRAMPMPASATVISISWGIIDSSGCAADAGLQARAVEACQERRASRVRFPCLSLRTQEPFRALLEQARHVEDGGCIRAALCVEAARIDGVVDELIEAEVVEVVVQHTHVACSLPVGRKQCSNLPP